MLKRIKRFWILQYLLGGASKKVKMLYFLAVKLKCKKKVKLAKFIQRSIENKFGCFISIDAVIHPTVEFIHANGIVIGKGVVVEENVIIYQQVTVGGGKVGDWGSKPFPTIKKGSILYAGCKVIGPIIVGENVSIGANAVVNKNVPDNSLAVGVPAKFIETGV
ncbi:hypothetical protein WNY79_08200 [Pseudoalteromonas sp. AS84]|uniref:serine O-acetyltransferase n=1 Tax=Pseudoalteromonas sp. AS84 TaxID=3135778 RepID=UPI00317B7EDF